MHAAPNGTPAVNATGDRLAVGAALVLVAATLAAWAAPAATWTGGAVLPGRAAPSGDSAVADGRHATDGGGRAGAAAASASNESAERHSYRAVAVFRVDDLGLDADLETVRAVGRVFAGEGVPVTLAVVPAAGGDPLDPDGRLCAHLAGLADGPAGQFEVAQHGYSHGGTRTIAGETTEFGGLAVEHQRRRIAAGRRVLADCVGRPPRTFVPPYDTYDEATTRALAAEGFTVVSGGEWFTREQFGREGPFRSHGVLHLPRTESMIRNFSTGRFHDRRYLERAFHRAYENGSVYVQVLHVQPFDDERRLERLRAFLSYVEAHDVALMTLGEFREARREGRLARTSGGWVYVPEE